MKKHNYKRVILVIVQIIFFVMLLISGYEIIKWFIDNNANRKILNNIEQSVNAVDKENKKEYKIDFSKLKQINNETIGWLKVNNTNIEYTVVKTSDNSFYLSHNFEKSNNKAGWIFADYRNKIDGTDKNIVIYGHNMRDGSMFGSLKNVLNSEWYNNEENKYITFITENENITYEIFSVYQIKKEENYLQTEFNNSEFSDFVNTIKSRSIKEFNVNINDQDNILTLSTCANNNNYRVVVHAKKIY